MVLGFFLPVQTISYLVDTGIQWVKIMRILALLTIGAFIFLKLQNLYPRASDENLYFWAAHQMSRGIFPYRDYFLGVLPGQIAFYALFDRLLGFRFELLKVVQIAVSAATGVVLMRLASRVLRGAGGIAAGALFLFSSVYLGVSDHAAGVHEATLLLVLFWYFIERRPRLAGLLLALGLIVRLYIFPAALGLLVAHYLWGKRRVVWLVLRWSMIPFALVCLVLWGMAGDRFIEDVWLYHLLKPGVSVHRQAAWDFVRNEKFLLLFSALGTVPLLFRRWWKKFVGRPDDVDPVVLGRTAVVALLLQSLFLTLVSARFLVYFVTLLPFLAVVTSLFFTWFLPERRRRLGFVAVGLLMLLNGLLYERNFAVKYRIEDLDAVVADTKANSEPGEGIFGTYLVTPLVALEAERHISEYEADTNIQRFLTGFLSRERATRLATGSAVFLQSAAVGEDGSVKGVDPAFVDSSVVVEHCTPISRYPLLQDFGFNTLVVWACQGK